MPGTYSIVYPEAQVCGNMTETVEVKALKTVNASIQVSNTHPLTNANVTFKGPKGKGVISAWDFGDGVTAQGATVSHQYANAGIYTATLTSSKGNCTDIKTVEINVNNTSIATGRESIEVQNMNGAYYVVFNADQILNANIKVHNALGQVIGNELTFEGKNGNVLIDIDNVPEGVYIVSITNGENIITRKIIK